VSAQNGNGRALTPDLMATLSVVRYRMGVAWPWQVAEHLERDERSVRSDLRRLERAGYVEACSYSITDEARRLKLEPVAFPATVDLRKPWVAGTSRKARAR
jgi:hypothetical protein